MSQSRRLTFAVSTSLLTASLATGVVGCNKDKNVNVHPDEVHTNPGPEEAEETVNEGPVADEADAPADEVPDADEAADADADADAPAPD